MRYLLVVAATIFATQATAQTITVLTASYGANVNATLAANNATDDIKQTCDGKIRCNYVIDFNIIGDPFPGVKKAYEVRYTCGSGTKRSSVPPEAGVPPNNTIYIGCEN